MAVTPSYLSFILDQLAGLGEVTAKRMFGGIGLYNEARFFGLIDDDVTFLRVDDASRPEYVSRGMPPFSPVRKKPDLKSLNYYQVPDGVLEDAELFVDWAKRACRAAALPPAKAAAKLARARTQRAVSRRKPGARS